MLSGGPRDRSLATVRQFEADDVTPRRSTLQVIQQAFELAGVALIEGGGGGPGVRLNKP